MATIATLLRVRPALVLGGDTSHRCVVIRQAVGIELRRRGYSYASIARASGWNHSTVMYWCKPSMQEKRKKYILHRYHDLKKPLAYTTVPS